MTLIPGNVTSTTPFDEAVYTHRLGSGYPSTATEDRQIIPLSGAPIIPPQGLYRVVSSATGANASVGLRIMRLTNVASGDRAILMYHETSTTDRTIEAQIDTDFIAECDGIALPEITGASTSFFGVNFTMTRIS